MVLATGTGSFDHLEGWVGGSRIDKIIGANQANTWSITNSNTGKLNALDFSAIESLTGGPLADAFVFTNGKGVTGRILLHPRP